MNPIRYTMTARGPGRPRAVVLTDDQEKKLAALYLSTNKDRSSGSMEAAWVLFCESPDGAEHAWTIRAHRVVGALPTAAVEVMRRARPLVGIARGGAKRGRSEGPYVAGAMRRSKTEERRLRAGERYSVDDLTRNVACWIEWPWGGCKLSDRFGVKLGRWQTLAVHDDATGCVIAVKSVFRAEQSYRGSDAASVIYQTERDIGLYGGLSNNDFCGKWIVEGGVWQSEQMLAALGGRFISAKGRPNQKLIERWFGSLQTVDSVNLGDLGRQRGEILETNAAYLACRRGERDPRGLFLPLEIGQASLVKAIEYLNEREIRSREYGNWVPQERWDADVAAWPLVRREDDSDAWVHAPERRRLTVTRAAMLSTRGLGPLGVPMTLHFTAPWLWEHAGRKLDLYFDPLGSWPIEATVVDPVRRKPLGLARCQDAYGLGVDRDAAMAAAIRRCMISETRMIMGTRRAVTERRGVDAATVTSERGDGITDFPRSRPAQTAGSGERSGRAEQDHEPSTALGGGLDLPRALGRRAAAARDAIGTAANW